MEESKERRLNVNEDYTHGPADHIENVSEQHTHKILCIGTTESRVFIIVRQCIEAEARQNAFDKEIGKVVSSNFHSILLWLFLMS